MEWTEEKDDDLSMLNHEVNDIPLSINRRYPAYIKVLSIIVAVAKIGNCISTRKMCNV